LMHGRARRCGTCRASRSTRVNALEAQCGLL
jgi:hypothetical protein